LHRCLVHSNQAVLGGGFCASVEDNSRFVNTTFQDNDGGAIHFEDSAGAIVNCASRNNWETAGYADGLSSVNSSPVVLNTSLWDDMPLFSSGFSVPVVSYCSIRGRWPGEHNIEQDCPFGDTGDSSCPLYLQTGFNPCCSAGTCDGAPSADCAGKIRCSAGATSIGPWVARSSAVNICCF
jgi:hypothetical protein